MAGQIALLQVAARQVESQPGPYPLGRAAQLSLERTTGAWTHLVPEPENAARAPMPCAEPTADALHLAPELVRSRAAGGWPARMAWETGGGAGGGNPTAGWSLVGGCTHGLAAQRSSPLRGDT